MRARVREALGLSSDIGPATPPPRHSRLAICRLRRASCSAAWRRTGQHASATPAASMAMRYKAAR
eukprot:364145-Chlamydomonas_euryale.AAC.1